MTPIPRSARPVVWFIRWWVKKPRTLPTPMLGWPTRPGFRWKCGYCPIGLLPMAESPAPGGARGAGLDTDDSKLTNAVCAFWNWWDSQTDARAAVDAVWPE